MIKLNRGWKESNMTEKATFAAGCFWKPEHVFRQLEGVESTSVGYMGGVTRNPTYEQVCTGRTGHAEVVQIDFDSNIISYEKLLDVFWECHDSTQLNRQGPDIGTQYRSAIFVHDNKQQELAQQSIKQYGSSLGSGGFIKTEICSAGDYWKAEDYHQQYIERRSSFLFGVGSR